MFVFFFNQKEKDIKSNLFLPLTTGLIKFFGTPWFCAGYDTTAAVDNFGCYKFFLDDKSNNWRLIYTSTRNVKNYLPHVVRDHLFFLGDGTTSAMPPPPVPIGSGACGVTWRDNLIVLGGVTGLKAVQLFTFSTNSWTALAPMSEAHSYFACLLLPNGQDQILVLGNQPGNNIIIHHIMATIHFIIVSLQHSYLF
jgi:hypothetical protein